MAGQEIKMASDGLPALLQGIWSKDKLHFLKYFMALFTTGMKNRWPIRSYVELFSGPGINIDQRSDEEFWGSAMHAFACATPFTHLYLNDWNDILISALEQRQQKLFPSANAKYYVQDCNDVARHIAEELPRNGLTLAFIDPWKYEIKFNALMALVENARADLVVTFNHVAIKRGAHLEIQMVDEFLDDDSWRDRYFASMSDVTNPPTAVLIDTFRSGLSTRLGYEHFGHPVPIRNTIGNTIFYLLFASKNARGLDFWEKSSRQYATGQRKLEGF
ncbi:MAG: three-Cys-motif partner protein TcmP [Chloroflexi bacterium]|nr:three-Cys-motif partner protein TcmP [Chloroflexota bacterium]